MVTAIKTEGDQMRKMKPKEVLALPMQDNNDAGVATVGDYLRELLLAVWRDGEGFDGKRPFGNSGWDNEIYEALVRGGAVEGAFDGDGYLDTFDQDVADDLIDRAICRAFRVR